MKLLTYDSDLTRQLYRAIALEFQPHYEEVVDQIRANGGVIGRAALLQHRRVVRTNQKIVTAEASEIETQNIMEGGITAELVNRNIQWDRVGVWVPVPEGEVLAGSTLTATHTSSVNSVTR